MWYISNTNILAPHFEHFNGSYPKDKSIELRQASYYWRLRKVREAFLATADSKTAFVEVPSSAIQSKNMALEHKIVAVIRGVNHLTLEITDQASDSFLNTLWGVMKDAW